MGTYRKIYKWGDKRDTVLDHHTLGFLESYFKTNRKQQQQIADRMKADVPLSLPVSGLAPEHLAFFSSLLGAEYVRTGDFERASHAFGKFYTDLLYMRSGKITAPPDAVLYPETHEQVQAIVDYCHTHEIPVIPFAGGSSVTKALEASKGGVAIDLMNRLNRVISFSEKDHTVRAQAGISGPELEAYLNARGYTCGHFPQSFEYSSLGGWIAARGAGQCSTGYGRAEDLVVALKVATPIGTFESAIFPAVAQAWDLNAMFAGSEGTLGVITEVTWKVFKYRPENRQKSSFIFKDFQTASEAMREMIQGEIGKPHLFRISDGQETLFAFQHKGFEGTWKDKLLRLFGYHPPHRSTLFVSVEGDKDYAAMVNKRIFQISRKYGAFPSGQEPINKWLEQRYDSSYLRDEFMDAGYMIDTLETAVTWENLIPLWTAVLKYFEQAEGVFGMSHISHVYENGCNIYAIFMSPMKDVSMEENIALFTAFHKGIMETFVQNGGSISHHHGVGRLGGALMPGQFGETGMKMLNGIKRVMDPKGIMNPGGTLGLDA